MSYGVEIQTAALRYLASLPADVQARITKRINALAENPRPPRMRRLKGKLKGTRRISVGDYRVAYDVDDAALVVHVWAIGHRRGFYDRLARQRRRA